MTRMKYFSHASIILTLLSCLFLFLLSVSGCAKEIDPPVIAVRLQQKEASSDDNENSVTFFFQVTNESEQMISFEADRFACVKHKFHKITIPTEAIELDPQESHNIIFELNVSAPTTVSVTTYTNEGTTATISCNVE